MIFQKKTIRYYYWWVIEFFKKNFRLILLVSILSFITIIGTVSMTPFIESIFFAKKDVIGVVGDYDFNTLPNEITTKISNGLIFIDEKGEIIPILASSWEIKENGKKFLFHLKNNLLWNDGKEFDAAGVNYQFKDVKIEIIDKKTLLFSLEKPFPNFLIYLTKPIIRYPLVGVAGLYKVKQISLKYGKIKKIYLLPNKKNLPIIIYKFYPNEEQLINSYKLGEVNQVKTYKRQLAEIFSSWKNSQVKKTVDYSQLLTLFFNLQNPILKEKDVRRAIEMSLDFEKFSDLGERAFSSIPPTSWAYNPNLKPIILNKEAAKKIIKKYLTTPQSAHLNFYSYYNLSSVASQIIDELKTVGIKGELIFTNQSLPRDFALLLAYWNPPFDPDQYFFWHSTQKIGNIGGYKNLKVDKLLEDGRSTFSIDERKQIYYELQKVMVDDPPAIFLFYPYIYTIRRK